jgi:hypothetical protein
MIYNKTFQDWLDFEIHWIVKERSRAGGPRREFWVLLRWLKNLWFILLTSSTLLYVRLTFLHNQTRWSHVSCTCVVPHHECKGWWSDLFHGSHLLGWILTCLICVLSVCKSFEGWLVLFFKMKKSWVVMSPRFAIHVRSVLWICEARIHSIRSEGVWGWTLSMQRLDAWIPFL